MKLLISIYCVFTIACSSSPDPKPSIAIDDLSGQTEIQPEQNPTDAACVADEKRSCHVMLGSHEGVMSCFVGVQYCVNEEWSDCSN